MLTDKEKEDLTEEVKTCVREVVHKELPTSLVEELAPMVRRSADAVLKRYRRWAIGGFLFLVVAWSILFYQLGNQANQNTRINHKQDCVLVGLIVGIEGSDHDPARNKLYSAAINGLSSPERCNLTVPQTHP